jgi:transposase-like protein
MFKSIYTNSEKREILNERKEKGLSVREICEKYEITVQTFYLWNRKFNDNTESNILSTIPEIQGTNPETENRILRRLYIDLSAHNYELAKFLEK